MNGVRRVGGLGLVELEARVDTATGREEAVKGSGGFPSVSLRELF